MALLYALLSFFCLQSVLWIVPRIDQKRVWLKKLVCLVSGFLLLLILAGVFFLHPAIDVDGFSVGSFSIGASDTDNAIYIGINSLFEGRYPYYEQTFLGNPLTPLPGSFLVELPLYLTGYTTQQNAFWIQCGMLFVVMLVA